MTGKIGFACKYMHEDQTLKPKLLKEAQAPYNFRATTMKWLRDNSAVAYDRMQEIIDHNLESLLKLVEYVGTLPPHQRMLRIGSDLLPGYTESTWGQYYNDAGVMKHIAEQLDIIGWSARKDGIRLSFHPGQFTVLASDSADIVNNSIEEFEYHATMARLMGYGQSFQDFKINVHISGRQGPSGIRAVYNRLSPEARNCITIENEENKWGLDDCLELSDILPIVLDVHHWWCREGTYIQASDDRFKRVVDSWRGVRPVMHYSVSREDYLVGHDPNVLPNMEQLLAQGYKKGKLRAHSDYMWNNAVNDYVKQFTDYADIMVEAKCKNLASTKLANYFFLD